MVQRKIKAEKKLGGIWSSRFTYERILRLQMFHYHSPAVQHRHLGEFGWRLAAARDGGQREGLAVNEGSAR